MSLIAPTSAKYLAKDYLVLRESRIPTKRNTSVQRRGILRAPRNAKIIATMNTADRSIALIDAAFRRRFHQYTLAPDPDVVRRWHTGRGEPQVGEEAATRLARLNDALGEVLDKGRLIGHSFFLRDNLNDIGFEAVWTEDLEPILSEHLFISTSDLDRAKDAFLKA